MTLAHCGSGVHDASHAGSSDGRHGARDAETLGNLASEAEQENALFDGFDALGDCLATKRGGEAEHAFDDGEVFRIVEHVANEGLIDFEDVDWKAFEISERGVAGAEVVESERDAEFSAGVNDLGDLRHVGQSAAFEHLDFESRRIDRRVGGEQIALSREEKSACCSCCAEILTLTGMSRPAARQISIC